MGNILRLTAVVSAVDAAIQKKIYGSSKTTLIVSNKEMKGIMKIIKYLEESGLLIKGVSKTIENEVMEQRGGFFTMFLLTLGTSLMGNMLAGYPSCRRNN